METKVERQIVFEYGPDGSKPFQEVVAGFYTWDELTGQIRDSRWGSPYREISRRERTVTYGDWEDK